MTVYNLLWWTGTVLVNQHASQVNVAASGSLTPLKLFVYYACVALYTLYIVLCGGTCIMAHSGVETVKASLD